VKEGELHIASSLSMITSHFSLRYHLFPLLPTRTYYKSTNLYILLSLGINLLLLFQSHLAVFSISYSSRS